MEVEVLQVSIKDKVNVLDVFLSAKEFIKKVVKSFITKVLFLFCNDSYTNLKSVPVRGPDIKVANSIITRLLF